MAHLTAGDITPIGQVTESTYGTTPTSPTFVYYEDVREGGSITPTDNPNPYINWRYSSTGHKTMNRYDYVNQQEDAGYNSAIECRDVSGWSNILYYGGLDDDNTPLSSIPSRSVQFGALVGSTLTALTYCGCKTDTLKISADVPAGIVKFDETVLASYRDEATTTFTTSITSNETNAVQWVGGVTLGGTTIYPQSFAITIKNNLGRSRAYDTNLGKSKTVALTEGRQEMELEMTVWMEDFTELLHNMNNTGDGRVVTLTLGSTEAVTLTGEVVARADGTNHGLIQDKQMQTLRYRLVSLYYTVAS